MGLLFDYILSGLQSGAEVLAEAVNWCFGIFANLLSFSVVKVLEFVDYLLHQLAGTDVSTTSIKDALTAIFNALHPAFKAICWAFDPWIDTQVVTNLFFAGLFAWMFAVASRFVVWGYTKFWGAT